jgi:hypothetical protein
LNQAASILSTKIHPTNREFNWQFSTLIGLTSGVSLLGFLGLAVFRFRHLFFVAVEFVFDVIFYG